MSPKMAPIIQQDYPDSAILFPPISMFTRELWNNRVSLRSLMKPRLHDVPEKHMKKTEVAKKPATNLVKKPAAKVAAKVTKKPAMKKH